MSASVGSFGVHSAAARESGVPAGRFAGGEFSRGDGGGRGERAAGDASSIGCADSCAAASAPRARIDGTRCGASPRASAEPRGACSLLRGEGRRARDTRETPGCIECRRLLCSSALSVCITALLASVSWAFSGSRSINEPSGERRRTALYPAGVSGERGGVGLGERRGRTAEWPGESGLGGHELVGSEDGAERAPSGVPGVLEPAASPRCNSRCGISCECGSPSEEARGDPAHRSEPPKRAAAGRMRGEPWLRRRYACDKCGAGSSSAASVCAASCLSRSIDRPGIPCRIQPR